MVDFLYRTEDIPQDEVLEYFVETTEDRSILNALKARNPTILVGSRGVGKSFLLRVAQAEMKLNFETDRILPVYVTFNKTSLINTNDPDQFQHWMLARLCNSIIRTLKKSGLLSAMPSSISILTGDAQNHDLTQETRIEIIAKDFEQSWGNPGTEVDIIGLPSIEDFKETIEDLCSELNITRFLIFIDEAAHIFLPKQQRQFFTLFRDLRSPYIVCNAAVYPGVTYFGETFQPEHDATMLMLNRDVLADDYILNMREIVEIQADSTLISNIAKNGENFALLAYAACGNPRILLKTIARAPRINSQQVNSIIKEYYRTGIWSEHSTLADKYVGHRRLIDWGRSFIEEEVLPELQRKNEKYLAADKKSTCFFWIHHDAPQPVTEALRILAYTGIVTQHTRGIKATRSEIGNRYMVNLGCLCALEATPTSTAFHIAKNLTPQRMSEYGANHPSYQNLIDNIPAMTETVMSEVLQKQLDKSIDVLDITDWQKDKLCSLKLYTIENVLRETETKLREIHYVGEKRARRMHNAAITAVYEYLSG